MTDHFAEAERILKGAGGSHAMTAALVHAVLAVAQAFLGDEGDTCRCCDPNQPSLDMPVAVRDVLS